MFLILQIVTDGTCKCAYLFKKCTFESKNNFRRHKKVSGSCSDADIHKCIGPTKTSQSLPVENPCSKKMSNNTNNEPSIGALFLQKLHRWKIHSLQLPTATYEIS